MNEEEKEVLKDLKELVNDNATEHFYELYDLVMDLTELLGTLSKDTTLKLIRTIDIMEKASKLKEI